MIDLYFWPSPNGHKVALFLEEACLNYQLIPVDITRGAQFKPEFLRISPNNRVPAMVDHDPEDGGEPIAVFESGAILEYLAEKTGLFLPSPIRDRYETLQWLYWQIGGLGPIGGDSHHFTHYGPDYRSYAVERYMKDTARLYAVLNNRLREREYINGIGYSIADMACYPWVMPEISQHYHLEGLPELERWVHSIRQRPATTRAYERCNAVGETIPTTDRELRTQMLGQWAGH